MAADEMVILRIKEFDKRHGGTAVRAGQAGAWLLFPDGAQRERNIDYGTPLVEPPADPYERAQLVLMYREAVHQNARDAFIEFKANLERQVKSAANWAGRSEVPAPPHPQAFVELERLQGIVRAEFAAVETARAAVEAAKPDDLRRQEEANGRCRALNADALDRLRDINI